MQERPMQVDPNYDRLELFRKTKASRHDTIGVRINQKKLAEEPQETNEEEKLDSAKEGQKQSEIDKAKLNHEDSNDKEIEHLNEIMNPEEGRFRCVII